MDVSSYKKYRVNLHDKLAEMQREKILFAKLPFYIAFFSARLVIVSVLN